MADVTCGCAIVADGCRHRLVHHHRCRRRRRRRSITNRNTRRRRINATQGHTHTQLSQSGCNN